MEITREEIRAAARRIHERWLRMQLEPIAMRSGHEVIERELIALLAKVSAD